MFYFKIFNLNFSIMKNPKKEYRFLNKIVLKNLRKKNTKFSFGIFNKSNHLKS